MYELIYNAEATPALRRIHFSLRKSSDDTPNNPVVTGVKVHFSLNGEAQVASTNDIVAVDAVNLPGAHYIELTSTEASGFVKGNLVGSIKDAPTSKVEDIQATILPYDPWSTTKPQVNVTQVLGLDLSGDGVSTPIHV